MKQYSAQHIRNVVLAGHAGDGKTSLAEACYYITGQSDRLGKVADGNTICDYDPEEIRRRASVATAVLPVEWKNTKINLLDTPGLFDFVGGVNEGVRPAGSVLIVISGKGGVNVGAEKAFRLAKKRGLAKLFFVNKMDDENADFYKVFDDLKNNFGSSVCPIVVPFVTDGKIECYVNILEKKAYKYAGGKASEVPVPDMGPRFDELISAMNEAVAETSEELMEKFFAEEPFTEEELVSGLSAGIRSGGIAPIFCGSATELQGIDLLMNGIVSMAPWAESGETATDADDKPVELTASEDQPAAAIVFKTVVDKFVGKMLYFKVVSGKV
ncbi:MAG: GTP-binding protein, partial [Oscillospiraceae bacterium]|nr:GTP-binding protein [Oscillospiraceae bacterium]